MCLPFNMLSKLAIAFLPRSKCLSISWLHSPSAVILEPKKIKYVNISIVSPPVAVKWSSSLAHLFNTSQPQLPFLYNGDTNVYHKSMKESMSAWSLVECVDQYRMNCTDENLLGTLVHLRHCAWPLVGIWKTQLRSPSSSSLSSYSISPKLKIRWFCNFVLSWNRYLQSNSCVLGMVLCSEDTPPNKTD